MQLGTQKNGQVLEISEKDRSTHMHVIGGIGRGKSRLLFSMLKQDIIENRGLCLLDPHGELYDQLISWLSRNKPLVKRRKIHLINVSDTEHSVGFNPLKVETKAQIPVAIDSASSGISHVWGGGDLTQTPLIKDTLERVLYVLAEKNLTLAEARYLIYYEHYEIREKLISNLPNEEYAISWKSSHSKDKRRFDEEFEAIQRRFRGILSSPVMTNILGQKENTIDFKQAMDNGEIILVNLTPADKGKYEDSRVLGTLLVNEMYLSARRRKANVSRRFYLYIDEAHDFISDRIGEILVNCRKYDLSLVIAHQLLEQLRSHGDLVYESIKSATGLKVAMGHLSADDSHEIAKEIFMGKYDPHRINPATLKPVVVGHEKIILHGGADGESRGNSQSIIDAESTASSDTYGSSSGTGKSEGESSGVSAMEMVIDPDSGLVENVLTNEGTSSVDSMMNSEFSGESQSFSNSSSNSRAKSEGETWQKSKVRSYNETLQPIIEERGNPYTLQEQEKMFADAIGTQNPRLATVKTPMGDVGQFKTLDANDELTTPKIKKRLVTKLVQESPVISTSAEASLEIKIRQKYLEKEVTHQQPIEDLKDEDFLG